MVVDTNKRAEMKVKKKKEKKKRKEKKRVTEEKGKNSGNQAVQQKYHQSEKHLGSPLCKILVAILKMEKGRTQTNWPKDKKVDDHAQGFTSVGWHRPYVKKSIEDYVGVSIQGHEDYIKKIKERQITVTAFAT